MYCSNSGSFVIEGPVRWKTMMLAKLGNSVKNRIGWYSFGCILLGLAVAYMWEATVLRLLIPLALFVMLYPMMLDLRVGDLRREIRNPRMLLTALLINFVLSPLLIFGLTRIFISDSSPMLLIGLILFGTVPGGAMVPAFTGMLRGNVSLSVTVTALSLLLSIAAVPFWAGLLVGRSIQVPPLLIAKYLAVIIALPMLLGFLTRRWITTNKGDQYFQHIKDELQSLSGIGLLFLVFAMFGSSGRLVLDDPELIPSIMLPGVCFVIMSLMLSVLLGKLMGASKRDAIALTMSTAVKNNAIAIALAASAFGPEAALVNTTTGPLVQLPIMLCFIRYNSLFTGKD